MQWLNSIVLIGLGTLLAVGNVWFAAVRSTIPLAINDRLDSIEVRSEKHPGKDDVYLLKMKSGQVVHVDQQVADELEQDDRLEKAAWDRRLGVNSKKVLLAWSADFFGMTISMPLIILVIISTILVTRYFSPSERAVD